jgi:nucleoid DNA-binding protein
MQDLIQQLKDRAGLTEEQAHKSLETIKEYIQSKLPPMMQGMVDNFMFGNMNLNNDDDNDVIGGR